MKANKSNLPDYVVRMNEELNELNKRIAKANQAITIKNVFVFEDMYALEDQLEAMIKYRHILMERLARALGHCYRTKEESCIHLPSEGIGEWIAKVL